MKTVKTTTEGKNFTVVNIGKLSEVKDYVLPLWATLKYLERCLLARHCRQQVAKCRSKRWFLVRIVVSFIRIKPTKNCTLFLKARASIRLMARCSPCRKVASYELLQRVSAP